MASTAAGQALTAKFRRDQLSIRARLLKRVLALWPLLDVRRLDVTSPEWIRAMVAEVLAFRTDSARSASSYYEKFRVIELPAAAPWRARWLHDAPPVDGAAITTSLLVTGPVNVKSKTARLLASPDRPGVDKAIETAARIALVDVSGAMTRHVLDGGREVLREEGARDRTALAFARISDGDPCYFCALMISRGFVYRSKAAAGRSANSRFTGEGLYKFHDKCACTVEPVFDRDTPPTADAVKFDLVYQDATAEASVTGEPVMLVFRRMFEGRDAPESGPVRAAGSGGRTGTSKADSRRKAVEAQIVALEPTFASLTARLAAGEPVEKPHEYQKNLLAKLHTELASL